MRKREYIIADPAKRKNVMKALLHDVGQLPDNKPWVVTVKRLQVPASDAQKGLWWIWMQILGDHIGYTKIGMYEVFKERRGCLNGESINDVTQEQMHAAMEYVYWVGVELEVHLPSGLDDYYVGLESMQAERGRNMRD